MRKACMRKTITQKQLLELCYLYGCKLDYTKVGTLVPLSKGKWDVYEFIGLTQFFWPSFCLYTYADTLTHISHVHIYGNLLGI